MNLPLVDSGTRPWERWRATIVFGGGSEPVGHTFTLAGAIRAGSMYRLGDHQSLVIARRVGPYWHPIISRTGPDARSDWGLA